MDDTGKGSGFDKVELETLNYSPDIKRILDMIDDCVFIVDINGNFMLYNKANARLDNLDPREVIGKHITAVYNLNEETSITLKVLQTKKAILNVYQSYEVIKGNSITSISSAYPIFSGKGLRGAMIVTKDMSVFKSMMMHYSSKAKKNKNSVEPKFTFESIIGHSPLIRESIETAKKAAQTNSSVLVYGETGTGKEMIVQSIHHTANPEGPFIPLNCAAIPENLLEGLLFGTAKGAFTGSLDHVGLFEKASGGTLYLDELDSMDLNLQAKLLRVIEDSKIMRVGETRERSINTRFMSSLSINPLEAIKGNKLRHDLFYRLGVVIIELPTLKQRVEDIPGLIRSFIEKNNKKLSKNITGVTDELLDLLRRYDWPGNVRELEHTIEGAMNMIGDDIIIDRKHLSPFTRDQIEKNRQLVRSPGHGEPLAGNQENALLKPALEDLEKIMITRALENAQGNISAAADMLGLNRQSLYNKLKKYNLKQPH